MTLEFVAGKSGSERPRDANGLLVAFGLPGQSLLFEQALGCDPAVETLLAQCVKFKFGHIEPTGVFGREVKLELVEEFMSACAR